MYLTFKTPKAALLRQLAFSLMLLSLLISCKESGTVGPGFTDESTIRIDTVYLTDLSFQEADPYLGKLTYSPLGAFNDPLFGEISSYVFFRPGITQSSSLSEIELDSTTFVFRLAVDPDDYYGTEDNEPTYSIYRVNSLWRGTTFRMSDELALSAEKIGAFSFSDIDTSGYIDIPLGESWISSYAEFYNNDEDNRDSTYRVQDFGLAVVPDPGADKILFPTLGSSQLLIIDIQQDTLADTTSNSVIDWGFDLSREGGDIPTSHFALLSTLEQFINIDLDPIVASVPNGNFVRVELSLTQDTLLMQQTLSNNQQRISLPDIRLFVGPSIDVAYDLGFSSASFVGTYDVGTYRFNLTSLFNSSIYGSTELNDVYIYADPNDGLLNFGTFFGPDTTQQLVPKLLLYSAANQEDVQ